MDQLKTKNILIAVSNKSAIDGFLPLLEKNGTRIWATEGTAKYIREKGFEAESIVSGFDFDGRVKSLDKLILSRVLADKSKPRHLEELNKLGAAQGPALTVTRPVLVSEPFDAVVVELYKLEKANFPESMDIGGVTLIRAAIKNFENVALAFDEDSIGELTDHLRANQGSTLLEFRKTQAKKAAEFIAKRTEQEADFLEQG